MQCIVGNDTISYLIQEIERILVYIKTSSNFKMFLCFGTRSNTANE